MASRKYRSNLHLQEIFSLKIKFITHFDTKSMETKIALICTDTSVMWIK